MPCIFSGAFQFLYGYGVPVVFEAQSNTFQGSSHSTGLYARFDAASATSMSSGGSAIATTMGTGMNYRRNSPIKARPKSWVYLRHGLIELSPSHSFRSATSSFRRGRRISCSVSSSAIATTMGTGMNYRRNSPIKARPKSWVYLRHGLLHFFTLPMAFN